MISLILSTPRGTRAPDGSTNTYSYDTLNRLSTLTNSATGQFGFGYDALSRRTQLTRPNGVNTNYTYDGLSHLLSVLHQTGSTTLDGASYGYDYAGNRTSNTNYLNGITSNYGYDAIYELLNVTQGGSTTESYSYDAVGNRLSSSGVTSYSYNTSNELTSTSTGSYTYDANGNTLTDASGKSYTWDFDNRMVSAVVPSTGTVTFKYDPFGRRIYKQSPKFTGSFLYDGNNLIETVNGFGSEVASYTRTKIIDEPLADLRQGTTSYYEQDGLGTVTSLSNSAGGVAETYTYDNYGNVTASTGTLVNPFRYTGRELDSETGIYYYRARYFDPATGRFLSQDPIRYGGGVNFYAYTRNNPVVRIDPFGYSDGVCNNPAFCVPGSSMWGTMYLGPDGVWYNDGPPPDPAPPVPDDGPTPPPNPPEPNKSCDHPSPPPPDEPQPEVTIPPIVIPPALSEETCTAWDLADAWAAGFLHSAEWFGPEAELLADLAEVTSLGMSRMLCSSTTYP